MTNQRPQRRITDHIHQEYWRETEQHRYQADIDQRLKRIEEAVDKLTIRITYLMGAIGLILVILPIAAPYIRDFIGVTP